MIGDSIPISHQIKYISASNHASNTIIQKIESSKSQHMTPISNY